MNPENPVQERDWKYMRSIHDELLHALCTQIHAGAVEIATRATGNPHERYRELYSYMDESNERIVACFDDWRRSNIRLKIWMLRSAELLPDAHVEQLSEDLRAWLSCIEADELLGTRHRRRSPNNR